MGTLRPRSLSGLLSAALLLIVLPLTAAVVYGGVQMRKMSRASDALVRDSVELTQQTQVLFQIIAAMERSASLYVVLEDPRLATAFDANQRAFNETLDSLAERAPDAQLERVRAAGRAAAGVALGAAVGDRSASLVARFDVLGIEASVLADQTRKGIDTRLQDVERRAQATQQWLLWSIMALVPASLALAAIFAFFVLRPLRALDRAISDLGRGAFSQAIAIPGPVDLAALGRQLEWLRTRLLEIAVERNRFLRHMSHELKTPLANIREGTDLLLDGAVGPLDVNQLEVASILRENALRLQQLIENLLSYSAWQSSASTVEMTPIPARLADRHRRRQPAARARGAERHAGPPDRRPAPRGRSRQAEAGARQPAVERPQVHAERRHDPPARVPGRAHDGHRPRGYRSRHTARRARQGIPGILFGPDPAGRAAEGHRHRAVRRARVRAGARRHHRDRGRPVSRRTLAHPPAERHARRRSRRMRHDLALAVLLACAAAAGCTSLDDRRPDTQPAPTIDDGQVVADYLATLDRLGHGGTAEQAEILESTRTAYLADPSTRNRLRYAFVLAVPGHGGADPVGARRLLGEALARPERC